MTEVAADAWLTPHVCPFCGHAGTDRVEVRYARQPNTCGQQP